MKNLILLAPLLFVATSLSAQVTFESGYFIKDNGELVECFIKNEGWRDNPVKFQYKLDEEGTIKTGILEEVKEFGILDQIKYIKHTVAIDVTPTGINKLTRDPRVFPNDETLFLKVLVEGDASLYLYTRDGIDVFLYSTDVIATKQLVNKRYLVTATQATYNTAYTSELRRNVSWYDNEFETPDYTQRSLVNYFTDYNTQAGSSFKVYKEIREAHYRLSPIVEIQIGSLSMVRDIQLGEDFASDVSLLGYRVGLSFEYILPFKQNQWGILAEPTLHYLNKEDNSAENRFSVDLMRVELGLGARRYFYLNENTTIYANALYTLGREVSGSLVPGYGRFELTQRGIGGHYSLGVGAQLSRLNMEVRYHSGRDIATQYPTWKTEYSSVAVSLGVAILDK